MALIAHHGISVYECTGSSLKTAEALSEDAFRLAVGSGFATLAGIACGETVVLPAVCATIGYAGGDYLATTFLEAWDLRQLRCAIRYIPGSSAPC